jgi:predicted transcriptional regulator
MARKKTPILTEAELKLMQVIWDLGEATVNDVIAAHPEQEIPAYNTILTFMRILEKKGFLHREKKGRSHVYRPLITREETRKKAVHHMVKSLFDGSPEELLLSIMKSEKMSAQDLEKLKKMIQDRKEN